MALQKKIIVSTRTSDLSGTEGAERFRLAIDGEVYTLDVTDAERTAILSATIDLPASEDYPEGRTVTLGDVLDAAEEAGTVRTATRGTDGSAVRDWAKSVAAERGWTIADRGRLPQEVHEAFAAHVAAQQS